MTEKEKVTVDAFLKSVFERVMAVMKKEMVDTENDLVWQLTVINSYYPFSVYHE